MSDAVEGPGLEQLLAGIDQGDANALMQAFHNTAAHLGIGDDTAMWAIAQLEAAVIANATIGREQQWRAQRLREMVCAALPAAVMHYASARGGPPQ